MKRSRRAVSGVRRSRAEWASVVSEWRSSGLSTAEFCRRQRVVLSSFRWWRWRLSQSSRPDPDAALVAAATLLPVRVVGAEEESGDLVAEASASMLELVHPSGVRLRVPAGFDERTVAGVLWALGEAGSC